MMKKYSVCHIYKCMYSPYNPLENNGGGWVTRRLLENWVIEEEIHRKGGLVRKIFDNLVSAIFVPFLHPTFTRFVPPTLIFKNNKDDVVLNFSGTFGGVVFNKNSTLVCHDLQCHRSYFFQSWARWSEGYLLRKAKRVVTLSERDAKIVHRLYHVEKDRVENAHHIFAQHIIPFKIKVAPVKNILFLGSLDRRENYDGIIWFIANVLGKTPNVILHIVGRQSKKPEQLKYMENIIFHGFVDNYFQLEQFDLMIAPMLSPAGIKIKVIEGLEGKMPILGTKEAFSGLFSPSSGFISNNPECWINTILHGGNFIYPANVK